MVERGFKARASRLAVEIRSEFGLKVTDVLTFRTSRSGYLVDFVGCV